MLYKGIGLGRTVDPLCSAVLITQSVEELITKTMDSNFVPITDDRGMFIGIVTRRSIIKHYYEKNILPQE